MGEVGNVPFDDAPQFALAMGIERVVVGVDVTVEFVDEITHAAACAVPPTVLNKMTMARMTTAKLTSAMVATITILFNATSHHWSGDGVALGSTYAK